MSTTLASTLAPHFWRTPIKYCRWAAHEKPAIFYSIVIGSVGPLAFVIGIPLQRYYGIDRRPLVPMTYPVPTGPRKQLEGYDD